MRLSLLRPYLLHSIRIEEGVDRGRRVPAPEGRYGSDRLPRDAGYPILMVMMRRMASAGLGLFLGFVGAAAARASIVEALELQDLIALSDHVVTATAMDVEAHRDPHGRIVTDVRVRIDSHLKGPNSPGDELIVRRLGGILGEIGMRVEGEAVLETGNRYMLFLRDRGPHCRPTGMSQGALRIETMADGRDMVMPGADGLQLVSRDGGRLVPAAPVLLAPSRLDDFSDRIRGLLQDPSVGPTRGALDVR